MANLKTTVFNIIDENDSSKHPLNRPVGLFIIGLIIVSVVAVILESDAWLRGNYTPIFYNFEVFAVIIFTIEYLSRIWTADLLHPNVSRFTAVRKYIFSPMAIVDLLAILPFYLELANEFLISYGIVVMDLRFIRAFRLMRLLRIFKLNRYNSSMQLISSVLKEEKEKLLVTIFMSTILLVISSALIYTVEHEGQPELFPNIYASMWWAVATLTTVGYGDVYPVTPFGRVLAGFIALLGIGLVALPTGILSSSFVQRLNEEKEEKARQARLEEGDENEFHCPHCGKLIEEHGSDQNSPPDNEHPPTRIYKVR